jgi:hypothetical protein
LNLGPAGYEPAALNQAELWAHEKALAEFMLPPFQANFNSSGHGAVNGRSMRDRFQPGKVRKKSEPRV